MCTGKVQIKYDILKVYFSSRVSRGVENNEEQYSITYSYLKPDYAAPGLLYPSRRGNGELRGNLWRW
jgi:hypothetical protein